ncbi:MAG: formate--tetrahydrofolate ligase [Terrimonas sp.]|nr:formate--tetrahydrofolate ligase [Terrimonas sp.]
MPTQTKPIAAVAASLGLSEEQIITYGKYKAKIDINTLRNNPGKQGKLILVTSITPTKAGNGKTTTSISLADGLRHIGKQAVLALREPSLGPCFGMKGVGTGAGKSQLFPADEINLHFTGDFHAVSAANNMLAALLDNYNFHAQGTANELKETYWRRVLDVNDRSLRYIITGLHGGKNGLPTETGFDITPASELMAILCLSKDLDDLKRRVNNILLGFTAGGNPLTTKDISVGGAITALMKDTVMPNLVQTLEGTPALVHGGPFANIAHGCNSIIATQTALALGEYVLTEAGFGSDLGAEKFFNIKCRNSGLTPALSIIVITTQSLKLHGEVPVPEIKDIHPDGLLKGMRNLDRHIGILRSFGQKVMVVLNRFDRDTDHEVNLIAGWCEKKQVPFAVSNGFSAGSQGSVEAAEKIVALTTDPAGPVQYTYTAEDTVEEKIRKVVRNIYGGKDIYLEKKARQQLKKIIASGYGQFPVCIAKTQYSFTDSPDDIHVYDDFIINIDELMVNAGAEFIVAVCGEMMRMPGLSPHPAATAFDVENGAIKGLG